MKTRDVAKILEKQYLYFDEKQYNKNVSASLLEKELLLKFMNPQNVLDSRCLFELLFN